MKILHRFAYYLGGFSIGLIILAFFLGGKRTTCDYSPEARVLKNIRIKERKYSPAALEEIRIHNLDTAHISYLLKKGDVDFSRSNTKLDSCRIYTITGKTTERYLELEIENCDSIATLQKILVSELEL